MKGIELITLNLFELKMKLKKDPIQQPIIKYNLRQFLIPFLYFIKYRFLS